MSMGALGYFAQGEQSCEKAFAFAHRINHIFSMGVAGMEYAALFQFMGDGKKTVEHSKNAIAYFEKSQGVLFLPMVWSTLGYGSYLLGEFNKALKYMEKGLKLGEDTRLSFFLSFHHHFIAMAYFELADLNKAKANAEQALQLAQKNNEQWIEGMSWLQLGRVVGKTEESQLPKAEDYILKGMKILEELEIKPCFSVGHLFLGELCANAGQKEKAQENLKKAETMFREMGMDYWLGRTRKLLEKLGT
jgi:tetratricopeptide (TPR) repeat protein